MKSIIISLFFFFGVHTGFGEDGFSALFKSPDGTWSIQMSENKYREGSISLMRNGSETSRYKFEGKLNSVYWSPAGKYVAINNHCGHRAWEVWIFSLKDGKLIGTKGQSEQEYVHYLNYTYLPDAKPFLRDKIIKIYPDHDKDQMRLGYLTIAYGWDSQENLLLFHELIYDILSYNKNFIIQAYTTLEVEHSGFRFGKKCMVKIVPANQEEQNMPPEVAKTLK